MSSSSSTPIKKDAKKAKENKSSCEKVRTLSAEPDEPKPYKRKGNRTVEMTPGLKAFCESQMKGAAQKKSLYRKIAKSTESRNSSAEYVETRTPNTKSGHKTVKTQNSSNNSSDEEEKKKEQEREEERRKEREMEKEREREKREEERREKEKEREEDEKRERQRREERERERERRREREEEKEREREKRIVEKTIEDTMSDKHGRKFNMSLAKSFFKQMMESQKTRTKTTDTRIEVMPDTSMFPKSVATSSSAKPSRIRRTRNEKVFRPSGDPVWFCVDPAEDIKEIEAALREDDLKREDPTRWLGLIEDFVNEKFNDGCITEAPESLDPFGTFEELEERAEKYSQDQYLQHCTLYNLYQLCEPAIRRYEEKTSGGRTNKVDVQGKKGKSKSGEQDSKKLEEKTAVVTDIVFNMDAIFSIGYDRRRPILSIQKFRRKYHARLSAEQEKEKEKEKEQEKEKEKTDTKSSGVVTSMELCRKDPNN